MTERRPWDYNGLPDVQREHEKLQARDPEHDRSSCACCCVTCDLDYAANADPIDEPVKDEPT